MYMYVHSCAAFAFQAYDYINTYACVITLSAVYVKASHFDISDIM